MGNATPKLDALFEEWRLSYPRSARAGFFEDGIVDEPRFDEQPQRILFVLLEPNASRSQTASDGIRDLRRLFRDKPPRKAMTSNLARWAGVLLDGSAPAAPLSPTHLEANLRRVAVMNLKKHGGAPTANHAAIAVQAWNDRQFIRREVRLIRPSRVVTCGETANAVFTWAMKDDPHHRVSKNLWLLGRVSVLPAFHPSIRPRDHLRAIERIKQLAMNDSEQLGA